LETNLAAARLRLSPEQVGRLDTASTLPLGYPHNMKTDPGVALAVTGGQGGRLDAPALAIP
jgi:hypothetical protein